MHRFTCRSASVLAGIAGVLAALAVATSLGQAASDATATVTTTTKTSATPTANAKTTSRNVRCRTALVAAKPPSETAESFGTLSCSAPLGKGVHHDRATVTRTSQTRGAFSGRLKLFFNDGALRGTYAMTFAVADKTVTYDGTLKISSGTGDFGGVTGIGTIAGTSTDAVHSAMTETLRLKLPRKTS